jgi:cyclohexyl-isocyanide hydratase
MSNDPMSGDNPEDRRRFLKSFPLAGLGAYMLAQTSTAAAADPGAGSQPTAIPPGTLGAASAGPGRLKIAMLIHPKMVMQDLIGPLTVFNIMRCETHLVWKSHEPIMTEVGLPIAPTTVFRDCPDNLDVLFAPGGLEGTIAMMDDPEVLQFFADRGRTARYVTSDCTGSLLLGAAGLLRGYKATSHWSVRDHLALLGATPVHERVVQDRNRITGGGVTAGIDFGLTLAALLRSQAEAEAIQLLIEYAPDPPFNAGTPETAPKPVYDRVVANRAEVVERARQMALHKGATFKS